MNSGIGQTSRRQTLRIIGVGVIGALAGCSGSGGSSGTNETGTGSHNGTATPAQTATADTDTGKYAGLEREPNDDIAKGIDINLKSIDRNGDTYTFHGSVTRERANNVAPEEDRIKIVALLAEENKHGYALPVSEKTYKTDELDYDETEIFDIPVEYHEGRVEHGKAEPTHWDIRAGFMAP